MSKCEQVRAAADVSHSALKSAFLLRKVLFSYVRGNLSRWTTTMLEKAGNELSVWRAVTGQYGEEGVRITDGRRDEEKETSEEV